MRDRDRWEDWALCKGAPAAVFFPSGNSRGNVAVARALCAACPVQPECLEDALDAEVRVSGECHGFVGGLSARERYRIVSVRRRERKVA